MFGLREKTSELISDMENELISYIKKFEKSSILNKEDLNSFIELLLKFKKREPHILRINQKYHGEKFVEISKNIFNEIDILMDYLVQLKNTYNSSKDFGMVAQLKYINNPKQTELLNKISNEIDTKINALEIDEIKLTKDSKLKNIFLKGKEISKPLSKLAIVLIFAVGIWKSTYSQEVSFGNLETQKQIKSYTDSLINSGNLNKFQSSAIHDLLSNKINDIEVYKLLLSSEIDGSNYSAIDLLISEKITDVELYKLVLSTNLHHDFFPTLYNLVYHKITDIDLYKLILSSNINDEQYHAICNINKLKMTDLKLYELILSPDYYYSVRIINLLFRADIIDSDLYKIILSSKRNPSLFRAVRNIYNKTKEIDLYKLIFSSEITEYQEWVFESLCSEGIIDINIYKSIVSLNIGVGHAEIISDLIMVNIINLDIYKKVIELISLESVDNITDDGTNYYLITNALSMHAFFEYIDELDIITHEQKNSIHNILSKHIINYTNELHNDNPQERIKAVEKQNMRQIYIGLSKGAEWYTSSFREVLFPKFKQALGNRNFLDVANEIDPNKEYLNKVLMALSNFDLLYNVLPKDNFEFSKLCEQIIQGFKNEKNTSNAALFFAPLIEQISSKGNSAQKQILVNNVVKEYNSISSDKKIIFLFSILSLEKNFNSNSEIKKDLIEFHNKYDLNPEPYKEWFDGNNKTIKVVQLFYNDGDGIGSFNSFINYTKGFTAYLVRGDQKTKIDISEATHYNVKKQNSKLVLEKEINGIKLIYELHIDGVGDEYVFDEAVNNAQAFFHRGHSYHVYKTFYTHKKLDKTMIIGLGSCGGYNVIGELYNKLGPKGELFATSGTGTQLINNPLILRTFEKIIETKGNISTTELHKFLKDSVYNKDSRGQFYKDSGDEIIKLIKISSPK